MFFAKSWAIKEMFEKYVADFEEILILKYK